MFSESGLHRLVPANIADGEFQSQNALCWLFFPLSPQTRLSAKRTPARRDKSAPAESREKENTSGKIYCALPVSFSSLALWPTNFLVAAVEISAPPRCILIKSPGFVLLIQHKPSDRRTKKVLSGVLPSSCCAAAPALNCTQILICPVSQTLVYQTRILAARHHSSPVCVGQVRRTHSRKQDKQMGEIRSWEGDWGCGGGSSGGGGERGRGGKRILE